MTPDEIRQLRKRVGLNQTDFGNVMGASQVAVSEWESGGRRPSAHKEAALHQWRARLDEMDSKEEETRWSRELLQAATSAGILAVLLRIFGSR